MNNLNASILGAIIGASTVWFIADLDKENISGPLPEQATHRPVIVVSADYVRSSDFPRMHIAAGQVSADQTIELSSRISGYISKLLPAEGAIVEADELLVEIDAATVESSIRQAKASLVEAKSELADARADVIRFTELSKTNAISKEDLRKARLRVSRATASVESAEAQLAEHQAELAYTQIKSPVRSRVIEHMSKAGDLAVPGSAILRLESLSNPHFETWIPISIIDQLKLGQSIPLILEGRPEPVESRITELIRSADPITRRCKVQISIPDEITTLVGHYGHAQFILGTDQRPVMPERALIQRAGIDGVFIIDKEGMARFRSVRTGRRLQNQVELLAGPATGTMVILNPGESLRDGDQVDVKPST